MAKPPNHYEILGVKPDVTQSDIKKAFRQLVKKFHPDLDYSKQDVNERVKAKELMQKINQAYEVLADRKKREAYDYKIGLRSESLKRVRHQVHKARNEEHLREVFLGKVFHPNRRAIVKVLNQYKAKLSQLEQDVYDEELLEQFGVYVELIEKTLRTASNEFTASPPPETLEGSVRWMRHSIAQAADGLEELQTFCKNFDYNHLSMAGNLFRISLEHAAQANQLTKL
jgi:molecular chaperone DnaJ